MLRAFSAALFVFWATAAESVAVLVSSAASDSVAVASAVVVAEAVFVAFAFVAVP